MGTRAITTCFFWEHVIMQWVQKLVDEIRDDPYPAYQSNAHVLTHKCFVWNYTPVQLCKNSMRQNVFKDYGLVPGCVKRCTEVRSIKWQLMLQKVLILIVRSTQNISKPVSKNTTHLHGMKNEIARLALSAICKQELRVFIIRPTSVKNVFKRGHFKHLL
jgi:hypothetical protein